MTDKTADFFISRAGADADLAALIGQILESAGISVILQQWDFGNRNFMERMHAALESGARVIALVSPAYLNSDHCMAEALNAIGHDPLNKKARLIVMRVAECTPGGLFTALAYWDLVSVRGNAIVLRDIVLAAVAKGRPRTAEDVAAYFRPARTVLHDRIRSVPNFTGRREDLAAIGIALWAGGHTAAITQGAVHGGGGVGKSTLAIQYAWENRERYAGVWWLGADSEAGIVDGLVALGAVFITGLAEVKDRAEAAKTALAFIAEGGFEKPWLLLYDNVEQPKALDGWMPRAGAHVLITTRWPDWQGRAAAVALGVFAPEEAVQFLLNRTGRTDADGAGRLAADAGYLPLALDHAAAFCVANGDSFDEYRTHLAAYIAEPLPEGVSYPHAVFATFSLAIEQAGAKCPEAEKLMGILAWLAPDDIPRDIITETAMEAMALRRATGALKNVSLLAVKEQAGGSPLLSVHRLVQMVMRDRLAARGETEAAAAQALTLVVNAFPRGEIGPEDVRSWPACALLRPHAISVLAAVADAEAVAQPVSLLLNQLALYLTARAEYSEAEPLNRRALAVYERKLGPDHPDVAGALNNLAVLLEEGFGNHRESEKLKRRALAILERSLDHNHPNVATALNNLAQLLKTTNRLSEAEPLMHRALAIDEKSFGAEHPKVAIRLSNLAALLHDTNRRSEAEPLLRRALAIDERNLSPDHPNVAIRLNNLGRLFQDTNRLSEAGPLFRRALGILTASLGPDHPTTQTVARNYRVLLEDIAVAKHEGAEDLTTLTGEGEKRGLFGRFRRRR